MYCNVAACCFAYVAMLQHVVLCVLTCACCRQVWTIQDKEATSNSRPSLEAHLIGNHRLQHTATHLLCTAHTATHCNTSVEQLTSCFVRLEQLWARLASTGMLLLLHAPLPPWLLSQSLTQGSRGKEKEKRKNWVDFSVYPLLNNGHWHPCFVTQRST